MLQPWPSCILPLGVFCGFPMLLLTFTKPNPAAHKKSKTTGARHHIASPRSALLDAFKAVVGNNDCE